MDTIIDRGFADTHAVSDHDRHWAGVTHLSALLLAIMTSWFAGVAGVAAAGLVYLLKRDASPFIADHAREALNFNLSMLIYTVAATAIGILLIGMSVLTLGIGLLVTIPAGVVLLLAMACIAVAWLVCSIIATVRAFNGETYRYPLTLRLVG